MFSKESKMSAARAWLKKASAVIAAGSKPGRQIKASKKLQGSVRAIVESRRRKSETPSKRASHGRRAS